MSVMCAHKESCLPADVVSSSISAYTFQNGPGQQNAVEIMLQCGSANRNEKCVKIQLVCLHEHRKKTEACMAGMLHVEPGTESLITHSSVDIGQIYQQLLILPNYGIATSS